MKTHQIMTASALILTAASCVSKDCAPREEVPTASVAKQQWVSIFNGEDLSGWTPKITGYEAGDNYGNTFRVEDGVLKVVYDEVFYPTFDRMFGHIFYETPYSHYRLRLEYRFVGNQVAGGPGWAWRNSGIMFHGQPVESMGLDQDFPVSIELQLLGTVEGQARTTANLCTPGTNVAYQGEFTTSHVIHSNSQSYVDDQWVTVEYEVYEEQWVKHWVNGELVLEYGPLYLDPRGKQVSDTTWLEQAIVKQPDLALTGGSISLQSESHPCEFRNIQILDLSEQPQN